MYSLDLVFDDTYIDCSTNGIDDSRNEGHQLIEFYPIRQWDIVIVPSDLSHKEKRLA